MNRLTILLISISLAGCSGDSTQSDIAPEVVDAWQEEGVFMGKLVVSSDGSWQCFEVSPDGEPPSPVFLWRAYEAGMFTDLPAPTEPFASSLGGTAMNDEGLKGLAGLENLHSLDISHTQVRNAGLGQLAANKNLQSVDLGESSVTDERLKQLAKVKSLQNLYSGSTALPDAGLKELVGLEHLRILCIYNTKVSDAVILSACLSGGFFTSADTRINSESSTHRLMTVRALE